MTPYAQLAALERLLDDPSPVVRQAVAAQVKAAGTAGILWLEKVATKAKLAPHAQSLLANLRTTDAAAQSFLAYLRAGEIDLEEACLLLERASHPSLPPSLRRRAGSAGRPHPRAHGRAAGRPSQVSATLPGRLRGRRLPGCAGKFLRPGLLPALARDPYPPRDSHLALPHLPARRSPAGPPLAAGRLAWTLHGRGLPRPRTLYIDCYEGGAFRTRAEIQLMLLDNQLPADEAFLGPVSVEQTLARCCRNLVSQYEAQGDDRSSRLFLGFVHALEQLDERA